MALGSVLTSFISGHPETIILPMAFSDTSVYQAMAIIGTALFGIRIVLMLLGGDGGLDLDIDHDAIDGVPADHGFFAWFSLLSILAFLMGAGWMGLACREQWGLDATLSAFIAAGFGFLLMYLAALCLAAMRNMDSSGNYDIEHAVGATGRVYRKIPARGEGTGEIEITVDARRKVLPATSVGAAIESFASARVVSVEAGETLLVEPLE